MRCRPTHTIYDHHVRPANINTTQMDHFLGELVVYVKKYSRNGGCKLYYIFNVWMIGYFCLDYVGTLLGTYEDIRFKSSESKKSLLNSVDLFGLGSGPELEKKLKYAEEVCTGVILAKELVNAPANVVTPG